MNFLGQLFLFLYIGVIGSLANDVSLAPEQIHISLGAKPSQMVVTWATMSPTSTPTVEYGEKRLDKTVRGHTKLFIDGGQEARRIFIHRVTIDNLKPNTSYVYHAGSDDGWSSIYWFTTIKEGSEWAPRMAIFGDLGNYNGKSIPQLQEDSQKGLYDVLLHVGDMAYDMDDENARVGDNFMRQMEPIAAYTPYMVCVGNHEQAYNFSNYVNRFSMINLHQSEINNHYYSFNIGPVHVIAFSTEFYFFYKDYGLAQLFNQYEWLKKDLAEANKPENRAKRPWIITMGHRPMYCNTNDHDDCRRPNSLIRKGIPEIQAPGLEDLFYDNGVDIEFWAHEHLYERLWPIYNYNVFNGSYDAPYTNPKAPIHITTGSAGCQESLDPFVLHPGPWSAKRISDYGFTRLTAHNYTHIHIEQISVDVEKGANQVVDDFWIIKNKHGYGSYGVSSTGSSSTNNVR